MPRKHRPFDRDGGKVRDANLIVIASEDTYAVKQYFARFKTRRVDVQVIPTEDGNSAPRRVVQRLVQFLNEYETNDGDEFWICIDRDRWDAAQIEQTARFCIRKGYGIAVSNPCFEVWLGLHFDEFQPPSDCNSDQLCEYLRRLLGGYSKNNCCKTLAITREMVEAAIERARNSDTTTTALIPAPLVTRMYLILEALRARDRIISFS